MLFRQKLDAFIRQIGPYGYIVNQTTKHDRVFDASGGVFLQEISRSPRAFEDAVASLSKKFNDASPEVVGPDLLDFIHYLEKHQFIVTGESQSELDQKDSTFSYAVDNPKTFSFDFRQKEEDGLKVDDSQKFLDNYLREHPSLLDFQMEVTSRCNERCIHCYIPHENKLHDIDFDFAISVIDQAAAEGVISLSFGGGEATIYPRLAELIRYARKKDLSVHLLSNLVSVNAELFRTITESNLALIQVSVYSLKADEHDFITRLPGSLEKTLSNIERLIAADVPVQISCPVMKVNYHSYKDVLTWAYDRKIKAYTDFIMMARSDGTTGNLSQRLAPEETKSLLADIIQVDKDYRVMVAEEPIGQLFMQQSDEVVCGAGVDTLSMGTNGDCYPCSGWQGFIVGNLNETPLSDLWRNAPRLKEVRSVKRRDFPQCKDCPDQNYCAMCMVRNFNETGDIFTPPKYFCQIAAINREVVETWRDSTLSTPVT